MTTAARACLTWAGAERGYGVWWPASHWRRQNNCPKMWFEVWTPGFDTAV